MPPFIYPKLSKLKSTMIIYLKKRIMNGWKDRRKSLKSLKLCHWILRLVCHPVSPVLKATDLSEFTVNEVLANQSKSVKFKKIKIKSVKTVHIG